MVDPYSIKFDPIQLLHVLNEHHVDFIVIGGVAAQLHGATRGTRDIDVTPSRKQANLERLVEALTVLETKVWDPSVKNFVDFDIRTSTFRSIEAVNLLTKHGPLDLVFKPEGIRHGFIGLRDHAVAVTVGGEAISVAGLDDVIRTKLALGRPKDLAIVKELRSITHPDRGPEF